MGSIVNSTARLLRIAACAALVSCASTPPPSAPSEDVTPPTNARPPSAAPEAGAACGDRTCGVDEICVPQGFCSGVRLPTPEERSVTYECVPIPHACAENPSCGCVGDVCRYGGCAWIEAGVVTCVCA